MLLKSQIMFCMLLKRYESVWNDVEVSNDVAENSAPTINEIIDASQTNYMLCLYAEFVLHIYLF